MPEAIPFSYYLIFDFFDNLIKKIICNFKNRCYFTCHIENNRNKNFEP